MVLAVATVVASASPATAAPGWLDQSFGSSGIVASFAGTQGWAEALQSDGKIVVVGLKEGLSSTRFAIARYLQDGTPDVSFGSGGLATTSIAGSDDEAYGVAIQSDGKIVAAGTSYNGSDYDFAVARYNSDGSPDNTFDGDGVATTPLTGYNDVASAIAIQPDGKIVVAGTSGLGSTPRFAAIRYNSDGSLDQSFDVDGKVEVTSGLTNYGNALALQSDGKIVIAGESDGVYQWFGLVRLNVDGSVDTGFGGADSVNGVVITSFGLGASEANGVIVQPDGKIVAVGQFYSAYSGRMKFAVARYAADGTLDPAFNSYDTGRAVVSFLPSDANAFAVTQQTDGQIVVAGGAIEGGTESFALARLNPDGTLDPDFGTSGIVETSIGTQAQANALAIQSDGRILAAGVMNDGSSDRIAIARYLAVPNSDLTLTLHATKEPILAGKPLKYTITIDHPGPDAAHNVVVRLADTTTHALPKGTSVEQATWQTNSVGRGKCRVSTAIVCNVGTLDPSVTAKVEVVLDTNVPSFRTARKVHVTASVTTSDSDPTPADDSASASTKVMPRRCRPDVLVELRGDHSFLGEGIYNTTGYHQTRSVTAPPGFTRYFWFEVENDGNGGERFGLSGTPGVEGFHVRYLLKVPGRFEDVTKTITAGSFVTNNISPGGLIRLYVVVEVTPSAPLGAKQIARLSAHSLLDPARGVDVARAKVAVQAT